MKTSTKIILTATSLGILSLGVDLQSVYAIKPQSQMTIMPQTHSSKQVAELSDGDGEENDATEPPEQVEKPDRINSSIPIKIQEANNSIGKHNDAKKALKRVKHNHPHAAANFDSNKQDDGGYDAPNDADSSHEDVH
jgi:hypothetical protein